MAAALFAVSMPSFWFGIMLLLVFALHLNLLPAVGHGSPGAIVLPALTLGLSSAAIIAALVRSSLREVLAMEFVATARAKGMSAPAVVLKHALRNAMIPVATDRRAPVRRAPGRRGRRGDGVRAAGPRASCW